MRHKKMILCAVILLGFALTGLQAQETMPTSGGVALGNGGSVTYTVGQILYTTNSGIFGSIRQGIQQPYEITIVPGPEEFDGIRLQCSVYPNPTTDFVKLIIENYIIGENLIYYFYDMNGQLIANQKVISKETVISMGNLVPATYFLKVVRPQYDTYRQKIKTFKIIKKN